MQVGYPNVGKSSTINALLRCKKVPVSSTPGRTKHFQTLYLDTEVMLCDCPGLVMPSFVATKAEMVLNGILPIDQMREYVPPVATVSTATVGLNFNLIQYWSKSNFNLIKYWSKSMMPYGITRPQCVMPDFLSSSILLFPTVVRGAQLIRELVVSSSPVYSAAVWAASFIHSVIVTGSPRLGFIHGNCGVGHHWITYWLSAYLASSHHLN